MNRSKKCWGPTCYVVSDPISPDAPVLELCLNHTRERDVLDALIEAGATGCNFYDAPAPRWAASVHKLRKRGIQIATIREPHGGEYPGHHARYVLLSRVTKVDLASERNPEEL